MVRRYLKSLLQNRSTDSQFYKCVEKKPYMGTTDWQDIIRSPHLSFWYRKKRRKVGLSCGRNRCLHCHYKNLKYTPSQWPLSVKTTIVNTSLSLFFTIHGESSPRPEVSLQRLLPLSCCCFLPPRAYCTCVVSPSPFLCFPPPPKQDW